MDIITYAMCKPLAKTKVEYVPAVSEWDAVNDISVMGFCSQFLKECTIPLAEGKKYKITTDSGSYISVCKNVEIEGDQTLILGNLHPMNSSMEDTCETFAYIEGFDTSTNEAFGSAFDYNGGKTFIISEATEIVQTIDPKYLPVVEITSAEYPIGEASGTSVALSEEESAQLTAFAKAKIPAPIRLKSTSDGVTLELCCTFDYVSMDGVEMYIATAFSGTEMVFVRESDGNWSMGD